MKKIKTNSNVNFVFFAFALWRIYLFLLAYLAPKFLPVFGNRFPYAGTAQENGLPNWIWAWGNFDGVHYIRIVQHGYDQFTQVFFPLYPLLIKLSSTFLIKSMVISALVISNLAFLCALFLFFKLVNKTHGEKVAKWSCIYLLAFPTSFYFGSVYTEGLFFLMLMASFYLYEQKKILLSSIVGSVASATRLIGFFLLPSMVKDKKAKNVIPLMIIPLGLILYMAYLKIAFDDPLYFLTAQSAFGQQRSTTGVVLLPQVFWRYFKIFISTSSLPLFNALFEFTSTIFAILALLFAIGKVKKEWLVFSCLAILTPTLTGTLTSMPRYVIIAFPIYIVLAQIKNNLFRFATITIFLILGAISVVLFTRGYWLA